MIKQERNKKQLNQQVMVFPDQEEDELRAIYDVDGAIKNFQKDQSQKKNKDNIINGNDPEMLEVSGIELSMDD